ncbi:MAG: hypothetical protein K1X92_17295 [Bacteroidia bacterium]|nr:hypothetical protein [Bacteroidia bacterium]
MSSLGIKNLQVFCILLILPFLINAQTPKSVNTQASGAATPPTGDFMYLVGMQIKDLKEVPLCYSTQYDVGKIKIPFDVEDTINRLDEFSLLEDPLNAPDCFVPELKLIYKNYTYVISMYCTTVQMYKNIEPYVPSANKMKPDMVFTESVYSFLYKLKRKHFKTLNIDPAVMAKVKVDYPVSVDEDSDIKELQELLSAEEMEEDENELVGEDKGEFDKIEIEEQDPDDKETK